MDATRFDHLARLLSAIGTRRGVLGLLAAPPMSGGLWALLGVEETAAKDRRRRRKRRHKRRSDRRKKQRKGKRKGKGKGKGKGCIPEPAAQTCAGKCGTVSNTCQQPVNCGSCLCDPPCGACFVCNAVSGVCEPDPDRDQAVESCGEPGQGCEDGDCGCDAQTCLAAGGCCAQDHCVPADFQFDPMHCGNCQTACAVGEICVLGTCCDGLLPTTEDLQAAIDAADPGATIILCAGSWHPTSTVLIDKTLTLRGVGADKTTFDGSNAITVLNIATGAAVTLEALAITGGRADFGAGVFNEGTLTLRDAAVTGNAAANQGGGIYNTGTVIVEDGSRLAGNSASGDGGAILNVVGTVTLKVGSLIGGDDPQDANSASNGGGIFNDGTLTLEDGSRVAGNSASDQGGGIYVQGGTATLHDGSRVESNSAAAGGGIARENGTVTLEAGALVCDNTPLANQCEGTVSGTCPFPGESCTA